MPLFAATGATGRSSVLLVSQPASFSGNIFWVLRFYSPLCLSVRSARATAWKSHKSTRLLIAVKASREGPLRFTCCLKNVMWIQKSCQPRPNTRRRPYTGWERLTLDKHRLNPATSSEASRQHIRWPARLGKDRFYQQTEWSCFHASFG